MHLVGISVVVIESFLLLFSRFCAIADDVGGVMLSQLFSFKALATGAFRWKE